MAHVSYAVQLLVLVWYFGVFILTAFAYAWYDWVNVQPIAHAALTSCPGPTLPGPVGTTYYGVVSMCSICQGTKSSCGRYSEWDMIPSGLWQATAVIMAVAIILTFFAWIMVILGFVKVRFTAIAASLMSLAGLLLLVASILIPAGTNFSGGVAVDYTLVNDNPPCSSSQFSTSGGAAADLEGRCQFGVSYWCTVAASVLASLGSCLAGLAMRRDSHA